MKFNMKDLIIFFTKYFKYIILAALIYVPVFSHLDVLSIRQYDEARLALNAYEMNKDGDLIVTHYRGKPDMWNTKPPLMIWLQVAGMKILGVNELAVRLPSAIAAFLTCLSLLLFSIRYLKNFWFGFIAVLVLITSQGYIDIHATRTGDYDALLTLFTSLSALYFFLHCETRKNKQLYLFFAFSALAVLTKSISGLLFIPAFVIYSIIQKQFIPLLKNKHFYIGLLSFLLLVMGYYFLREYENPGYLAAVQKNELGGRFLNVIEKHDAGFWFYYHNFIDFKYSYWYLLVPAGLIIGFISKNNRIKKLTLFSFLILVTYFLIISSAKTKLKWYDVPLYPFLAIISAVFIDFIFEYIRNLKLINQKFRINIFPYLFLVFIFFSPYQEIFAKTFKPQEYPWNKEPYKICYYLKDAIKGKYNLNDEFVLSDGYSAHIQFYLNILNDKGIHVNFKNQKELKNGDIVIAYQEVIKKYIDEHYKYEILYTEDNLVKYKIYDRRQ